MKHTEPTPEQRRGSGRPLSHTFESLEARLQALEDQQGELIDSIRELASAVRNVPGVEFYGELECPECEPNSGF